MQSTNEARSLSPSRELFGLPQALGSTPTVQMRSVLSHVGIELFAKLEAQNPGGSMKDRGAFRMIRAALRSGELRPDDTVIESSSGNMGVGLAQACLYFGLRFVCITDERTTPRNLCLLEALGSEVRIVRDRDLAGRDPLAVRRETLLSYLHEHPRSFWPDQYSNLETARAQSETMREIVETVGRDIRYVFVAASTGGTLLGCAQYLRQEGFDTSLIAVDAQHSAVFGGAPGLRRIPGLGAGREPDFPLHEVADRVVRVSDLDCVIGCRMLLKHEALLLGGSSGGIVRAVERAAGALEPDGKRVAIFPDRGERYLDTVFSDAWVRENFGETGLQAVLGSARSHS